MQDNVYSQLHIYAFETLKKFINNPLEKKEIKDFAQQFLDSSQVKGEEAKTSLYFIKIASYIDKNININILKKDMANLDQTEIMIVDKVKDDIKKIIGEEINRRFPSEIKKVEQKEETQKAKNELNQSDISVIEDTNGNRFAKMNQSNSAESPILAQMVGNTTVNSMINDDASFIIDGSVSSVKKSDEIISDFKKNRITNDSMMSLNNSNTNNLDNEQKQEITTLKTSGLDLDGAKYDTRTNLAFTADGKILDTQMSSDGNINIQELKSKEKMALPKSQTIQTQDKDMTKTQLFELIEKLQANGVNKEEAKARLKEVPTFNKFSEDTQNNIFEQFHDSDMLSNGQKKENLKSKSLTKVPNYPMDNKKAGIASSIIVSFVSGVISGVIIMLLVYFFLTH